MHLDEANGRIYAASGNNSGRKLSPPRIKDFLLTVEFELLFKKSLPERLENGVLKVCVTVCRAVFQGGSSKAPCWCPSGITPGKACGVNLM